MTIRPALSDLFFNFSHPNWDASLDEDSQIEPSEAILMDAGEFVANYGELFPSIMPQDLADDFLSRV